MRQILSCAAVAAAACLALAACDGSAQHQATTSRPAATASPAASHTAPSAEVIAAGLHLRHVHAYNAATDPNHILGRQHGYTSKVNWGAARAADSYNSIEVFGNTADARARKHYLADFSCPFGDGYDYLAGAALLRIDCQATPAQARALEARFRQVLS